MHPREFNDLDEFIDAALREEPFRPAPLGFQRRMEERLRVSALLQRERSRFRRIVTVAALVSVCLMSGVTLAAVFGDVPGGLTGSIPGALGYYDQFIALFSVYWPHVLATAITAASVIGAGLVVFVVLPYRRSSTG